MKKMTYIYVGKADNCPDEGPQLDGMAAIITARPAAEAAFRYAGVSGGDVTRCAVTPERGIYDVQFETAWLRYNVFVDSLGEVIGCDFEPAAA